MLLRSGTIIVYKKAPNNKRLANTPVFISRELAAFFKIPAGTMMSKIEACKRMVIDVNPQFLRCKDCNERRYMDAKKNSKFRSLLQILKIPDNIVLSYFSLQKYLNFHLYNN